MKQQCVLITTKNSTMDYFCFHWQWQSYTCCKYISN